MNHKNSIAAFLLLYAEGVYLFFYRKDLVTLKRESVFPVEEKLRCTARQSVNSHYIFRRDSPVPATTSKYLPISRQASTDSGIIIMPIWNT